MFLVSRRKIFWSRIKQIPKFAMLSRAYYLLKYSSYWPLILHKKMTVGKRLKHWVISRMKNPRIWVPPAQFQNLSKNFKIEFPGNWSRTLISPESAWFTKSFPVFLKNHWHKKVIPEFNLPIGPGISGSVRFGPVLGPGPKKIDTSWEIDYITYFIKQ